MTRFTNLSQIANCSHYVRAQLEKHIDAFEPGDHPPSLLRDDATRAMQAPRDPGKRRQRPEQDAGKLLVQWIDYLVLADGLKPGLFFAHVPNGGARSGIEAGILKGQGVRPGFPDYLLMLPRKQYHGLVGELKAVNGSKPDPEQLEILQRLESVGYKVCIWWGFEDAKRDIERYLDIAK